VKNYFLTFFGVVKMPRISSIEIIDRVPSIALTIRVQTPVSNMPVVIGESYGKMLAYLQKEGRFLSAIPYVAFYNMEMNNLDVEMGFPLSSPLPDSSDMKMKSVPGGKAVMCMYLGPYQEMEPTYNEVMEKIAEMGYEPTYPSYELYYNGPQDVSAEHFLTELIIPIKEK
jgi:effector-binding domain-containing protein